MDQMAKSSSEWNFLIHYLAALNLRYIMLPDIHFGKTSFTQSLFLTIHYVPFRYVPFFCNVRFAGNTCMAKTIRNCSVIQFFAPT